MLSAACAVATPATSLALSRRRSAHLDALAMSACLAPRTALMSSLLPPNFSILTSVPVWNVLLLLLWSILLMCCESLLQFSNPLRQLMDLRCQRGLLLPVLPCCWTGSTVLVQRAISAATAAVQIRRSATMQVVNMR